MQMEDSIGMFSRSDVDAIIQYIPISTKSLRLIACSERGCERSPLRNHLYTVGWPFLSWLVFLYVMSGSLDGRLV